MIRGVEEELRERTQRDKITPLVLAEVIGGVWHTTSRARFSGIVSAGAILPEPPIADSERWSTSQGAHYYPYVRTLGGVSLFDFTGFEPESYSQRFPNSSWWEFIPYLINWKEAVWIEIDTATLGQNFVSGKALLLRWKDDLGTETGRSGNRIMPEIEAAHLGPIPVTAFRRAFAVREGSTRLEPTTW